MKHGNMSQYIQQEIAYQQLFMIAGSLSLLSSLTLWTFCFYGVSLLNDSGIVEI